MKKTRVFYWCPFIDKVATIKAVYNSALSLNKYSFNKFEGFILDVFGEWSNFNNEENDLIKFEYLNKINILNYFSSQGFIKSRMKYILIFLFSYFPLKKFLLNKKPEFLIIHLVTSLPLFLNLINTFETKMILRISGKPKLNIFRYYFWLLTLKKIHKITFPTMETLNHFKRLNITDPNKLELLYDPIIIVKSKKKKIENNFKFKDYYLAIGRLTRQKNFLFLLKCFKILSKTNPNTKLIILGEGEQRSLLEKFILNNDLKNNVFLPGYETDVYKYLYNCKLFILSSLWEDPGFVILEAMHAGSLVLSSDCPSGPKEIVSNSEKRGILFKSNNIDDFLLKLNEIQNLNSNKARLLKLNAKKFTKKFSIFNHHKSLSKILDN